MTMKHICILFFLAVTTVLSAAETAAQPEADLTPDAEAAAPDAARPPVARPASGQPAAVPAESSAAVLTLIYRSYPEPSAYADPEKAAKLLAQRAELIRKIQDERKRLLEEDATAKKLREDILTLNRKLASHIQEKGSMIRRNSELRDLDRRINGLKPAPPPPPPESEVKDDSAKDENAESAGKTEAGKTEAGKTEAGKTEKSDKPAASAASGKTGASGRPAASAASGRTGASGRPAASAASGRTETGKTEKSDKPAVSEKPEKTMPPPPKDDKTVKPVKE